MDEEVETEDKIMLKDRKKEFNSQSEENKKAYLKNFLLKKFIQNMKNILKTEIFGYFLLKLIFL